MPPIAAIILCAGDSSRMGSPKALLKIGARTFLNKIIADYQGLECRPIIVVAGRHYGAIQDALAGGEVELRRNTRPELGTFSSIRIAMKALPEDCPGFFIHPVDHPAVIRATLRKMLRVWKLRPEYAVKPTYQDRGGHPLLLGQEWRGLIQKAPASSTLRELLQSHHDYVLRLPVNDRRILLNVNEPADLEILSGSPEHSP